MKPVQYRSPRLINPVSVTLLLLLLAGAYAGYEFVRVDWTRQDAYRVLEETGSAFAGRRAVYQRDAAQREALRSKMQQQLIALGITDPEVETWIELEEGGASLGVVYTAKYHWPFDVLAPIPRECQVEHKLVLPTG